MDTPTPKPSSFPQAKSAPIFALRVYVGPVMHLTLFFAITVVGIFVGISQADWIIILVMAGVVLLSETVYSILDEATQVSMLKGEIPESKTAKVAFVFVLGAMVAAIITAFVIFVGYI